MFQSSKIDIKLESMQVAKIYPTGIHKSCLCNYKCYVPLSPIGQSMDVD